MVVNLTEKIIEKQAIFHNVNLTFFSTKNTISCGIFSLPTKPIVESKTATPTVL
jgi:hypothetical protein